MMKEEKSDRNIGDTSEFVFISDCKDKKYMNELN